VLWQSFSGLFQPKPAWEACRCLTVSTFHSHIVQMYAGNRTMPISRSPTHWHAALGTNKRSSVYVPVKVVNMALFVAPHETSG